MAHDISVDTGKAIITLDELGSIQPGMSRLMAELAPRVGYCYHAAMAENWELARYMLTQAIKLMRTSMVVRPKFTDHMMKFIADECMTVLAAIKDQDVAEFQVAFDAMTQSANAFHKHYGVPYIWWQPPGDKPTHLDLDHKGDT